MWEKKNTTTGVNVVVGIIESACDEDQSNEAKSEPESKACSWRKKANHCQLWLDLYIITRQGQGQGQGRGVYNVKTENKN